MQKPRFSMRLTSLMLVINILLSMLSPSMFVLGEEGEAKQNKPEEVEVVSDQLETEVEDDDETEETLAEEAEDEEIEDEVEEEAEDEMIEEETAVEEKEKTEKAVIKSKQEEITDIGEMNVETLEDNEEDLQPTYLSYKDNNISIEVEAEEGVLPEDARISLSPISEEDLRVYEEIMLEKKEFDHLSFLDIDILDSLGNKIQPNGELKLSINGLDHIKNAREVTVSRIEKSNSMRPQASPAQGKMALNSIPEAKDYIVDDFQPRLDSGNVTIDTDHFTIYIVGSINTSHPNTNNRYQMEIGDIVEIEERDLQYKYSNYNAGQWSITEGAGNPTTTPKVKIEESTVNSQEIKATIKAISPGSGSIKYEVRSGTGLFGGATYSSSYFRINVKGSPSNHDTKMPAPEQEVVEGELEPGTVAANKDAKWDDYDNRIAVINFSVEGMPIISGSDVVLVMDVSGSMRETPSGSSKTRMEIAQDSGKAFVNSLLENNNKYNNRVAFIPFSGSSSNGGENDSTATNRGSINFSTDRGKLLDHIKRSYAEGGTNYTAALQKTINYSNTRSPDEKARPLYVVFLSDGAPGYTGESPDNPQWNGTNQANTLKGNNHKATIYSVGMWLPESEASALKALKSSNTDYYDARGITDLDEILSEIAGQIKKAGTEAVLTDYLNSTHFDFDLNNGNIRLERKNSQGTWVAVDASNYDYYPTNHKIEIKVGDILEDSKEYRLYVRLKEEYADTDASYFTNSDVTLDYEDVDGNDAHKVRAEIGHPSVSRGHGQIKIKYVLVNEDGDYIKEDNTVVNYPFRHIIQLNGTDYQLHEEGGDSNLSISPHQSIYYNVNANVPNGYELYDSNDSPENVELIWNDRNKTVEFKVVRSIRLVNITIQKQVTGNYGDQTEEFNFSLTGYDDFTLKHGASETFTGIPANSTVTLVEEEAGYDSITAQILIDGEEPIELNGIDGTFDMDLSEYDGDITIVVTNHKDVEVDTGISLDTLPYILVIAMAAVGSGFMLMKRRKLEE